MNTQEKFNSLNGTTVSRSTLENLLAKAKNEKLTVISKRIIKVLKENDDDTFVIELKNLVEPFGLNAAIKNTQAKKKATVLPEKTTPSVKKKTAVGYQKKSDLVKPKLPVPDRQNKSISDLEKMGFVSAAETPKEAKGVFVLPGELGKFLQKIQPHKALILIKGTKHTSKSQLAMQIANAFGEVGKPVAYIDYEQGGIESKDTIDSINRNTSVAGRKNIAIIGYLENPMQQLKDFCKYCKIVVADSVTDLGITADQLNELRTAHPEVIWCFISQVRDNGAMYGGNKMCHNPTVVIECHPSENPALRYATFEKNRGNDLGLKYNMFNKKLIAAEKKPGSTDKKATKKLSFKVK